MKKREGPQFITEPQHIEGYTKVVITTTALLYGRFRGLRCVAQNLSQAKFFHAES